MRNEPRGQRAQLDPCTSVSITKTHRLCVFTISICATPVSVALRLTLVVLDSGLMRLVGQERTWFGARVSHGERENRENLKTDEILSNFYMFSWR